MMCICTPATNAVQAEVVRVSHLPTVVNEVLACVTQQMSAGAALEAKVTTLSETTSALTQDQLTCSHQGQTTHAMVVDVTSRLTMLQASLTQLQDDQAQLVTVAQETATSLNRVQSGLLDQNGALDSQFSSITAIQERLQCLSQALATVEPRVAQMQNLISDMQSQQQRTEAHCHQINAVQHTYEANLREHQSSVVRGVLFCFIITVQHVRWKDSVTVCVCVCFQLEFDGCMLICLYV
jgi:chromosome segregation ATPase